MFSELGTKKNIGFTACSELRTKQTIEIQWFRDFEVLGQNKKVFSVCVCVLGVV